ncbi:ankyrin repeat domain-containing protein 61-like [Platichthys flesus]|uniref:ankyrin repeat domain-containing protein 61-like n=1 Tax=Platichthys flesus TaxID=8260 RepID=UPI002DBF1289|nr:ankyrin repeat domain-containing protein 61-like [Platichthys flesus]
MLEEQRDHEDTSSNMITIHNNEFYTAIMDEDVGSIEDMAKKHGRNLPIQVQVGEPGNIFWKGPPLHLAASYRRVKSMQNLLSLGADPGIRDQHGRTTLHRVMTSWPRTSTPWTKPDSNFQNAVIGACRKAEACLQLLCEHGVNVNAEVERESLETALHLSVRYAALFAVQTLTSHGAEVDAVNSTGMTPLHMAAGILHKDILVNLIKHGADINRGVKHTGSTALHLAAVAMAMKSAKTLDDDINCISELLEHGAKTDTENKAGLTPLQEACCMGNEEVVDLLLRYGADINKLSRAGENCLFLFLNHRTNVNNSSLLGKLINLTSPLTVYNQKGLLPSTLTLPCFCKQREQLLKLIQQPRRLQDICKSCIYLKHVQRKKGELTKMLPERLWDFVFNSWENIQDISFLTDDGLVR